MVNDPGDTLLQATQGRGIRIRRIGNTKRAWGSLKSPYRFHCAQTEKKALLLERSVIWMGFRVALAGAAAVYLSRQVTSPTRFVGRLFAWLMNHSHSALTDWALTHVDIPTDATVLDVGCGGGRTIEKLARTSRSVYGIDYAAGSVAASRSHNQALIATGQVTVERASVSHLPFTDNTFDLATAIETQYYWPDTTNDMREILRVLKPGGRLVVVLEAYKSARNGWFMVPVMRLLGSRLLTIEEQRTLFQAAGFTDVETFEQPKKGWLCAIGRKAAA